ncbi:hypothetical protein ACET6W_20405, partial [Aeromonas veronii]
AGAEEVESLVDTHKKSETNQQVSDFHTTEGSVNGSLTDRHYANLAPFLFSPTSIAVVQSISISTGAMMGSATGRR